MDLQSIINPDIPLVRYRIRFQVPVDQELSELRRKQFLGSAWRGVFGKALKRTVCVTRLPDCDPCPLVYSCPYTLLFENRIPENSEKLKRYSRMPNPYVLEPENTIFDVSDNTLSLGLILIGNSNNFMPYIVFALERAARFGLTKRKIKLVLMDVQAEELESGEWTNIYHPDTPLSAPTPLVPIPPEMPYAIRITLVSPLRIRFKEKLVGANEFRYRAFAANLLRRVSLLSYFFGNSAMEADFASLINLSESVEIHNSRIKWQELTRFSSRQNTPLKMGGLVGSFDLSTSALSPYWNSLWLGQWIHIGRSCTMGMGRYSIQPLEEIGGEPENIKGWKTPTRL